MESRNFDGISMGHRDYQICLDISVIEWYIAI